MPLMMLIPAAFLVGLVALGILLWTRARGSSTTEETGGEAPERSTDRARFWGGVLAGTAGVLLLAGVLVAVAGVTAMTAGGMDGMMENCERMSGSAGGHGDHAHQEDDGETINDSHGSSWATDSQPKRPQPAT